MPRPRVEESTTATSIDPASADRALAPPGSAKEGNSLKHSAGSDSDDFNKIVIAQAIEALPSSRGTSDVETQTQWRAALAAMAGIGPTSELEGMIASQLVALHGASMESFRRATFPDQPSQYRNDHLRLGINASRAFAALITALDRHRGKGGEQRVIVEHVHVHQGGQAIVGACRAGGRRISENGANGPMEPTEPQVKRKRLGIAAALTA